MSLNDRLEQALAAPFQTAKERYTSATIALRARQDKRDELRLDERIKTLAGTREAWRAARERDTWPLDLLRADVEADDASRAASATLERELAIVAHILAGLAEEHAAAVRASDSPAALRAHALIARARKLRGQLQSALRTQLEARRV